MIWSTLWRLLDISRISFPDQSDPGDPLISTGTTGGGKVKLPDRRRFDAACPDQRESETIEVGFGSGLVHWFGEDWFGNLNLQYGFEDSDVILGAGAGVSY